MNKETLPPLLVSTKELGDMLGVTRQAIYKWRKKGCPVAVNFVNGRMIRYDFNKVLEWLNNGREKRS